MHTFQNDTIAEIARNVELSFQNTDVTSDTCERDEISITKSLGSLRHAVLTNQHLENVEKCHVLDKLCPNLSYALRIEKVIVPNFYFARKNP